MNQHIPLSNIINKLQRKELLLKLEYDYEKKRLSGNRLKLWASGRKSETGVCAGILYRQAEAIITH